MLVDAHAHYDDEAFGDFPDDVLRRASAAGVGAVINAATNYETAVKSLALSERYPNLYCVLGIHPEFAETYTPELLAQIERMACSSRKVVGIGETGLDYHYLPKAEEAANKVKFLQKRNFIANIRLSEKLSKPLVVHDRDAHHDTLCILRDHCSGKTESVLHCYSGSAEMVRDFTELNFSFSVGGVLTFKNASKLVSAVKAMPRERILLETDSPYLAPEPMRGKRNDSSFLEYTARRMAEILDVSFDDICQLTTENAFRIFGTLHEKGDFSTSAIV